MNKDTERPGWGIVERYLPDASPEKKEEAYESLRRLMALIIEVNTRLMKEESGKGRELQPPLF